MVLTSPHNPPTHYESPSLDFVRSLVRKDGCMMRKSRFTDRQILEILAEGEAGAITAGELCREHGISEAITLYSVTGRLSLAEWTKTSCGG